MISPQSLLFWYHWSYPDQVQLKAGELEEGLRQGGRLYRECWANKEYFLQLNLL